MLPLSLDVRLKSSQLPKAITGIIISTGVLELGAEIFGHFSGDQARWTWLAFHFDSPDPLQFLLAIVSHGGWEHWFWNMFYLWVFGAALEDRLGWRKFLALFWICGIGAGLLQVAIYYPYFWSAPHWPKSAYLGASGAIFGIMGLCQARFLKARMRIGGGWFTGADLPFFSWQVPVTWLCAYRLAGEILSLGANDHIAHLAHVGGFLAGLACADFLGLKKESYDELIQNQAEQYADMGWWREALERYDRLLAMHPRKPQYREARLNCLYKLWPKGGRVEKDRRKRTLDELERILILYLSDEKPADAVRLFRQYVPPFSPEDLPAKLRFQIDAMRKLYPPSPGHYLDIREHADMVAALQENILKSSAEGNLAEAARAAADLIRCRDLSMWGNEALLAGAQAMTSFRDSRGADLCEQLIRIGDQEQSLKALLLLEKLWKHTPKQAGFETLLNLATRRFAGLNENLRYQDLKHRLILV